MIIYSAFDIEDEFSSAYVGDDDVAREFVRTWGYSYIIGWVTFILSFISVILACFLSRSRKKAENA